MGVNDTRRLRVVVTGDSSDAQQALEEVGESADQTESRLVTLTRTIASFAGRGALALGAVGAAAATMGISTASQLEQVEVGFTTMLGSATKAQKFLKELQDFAAATPFEFTELVGSAQRFLAMGFAAKDVIPMLTAVGDAVAAMGGSAESVDSVTTALGQMQAKGKVSGEELMQLTEQGIPALKILADQYGVSTSQMSDMITKGQVMSSKAIPAIIDGLKNGTESVKGFGGMMEKQSATMQGKWSTFMDTLKMGLGTLASNVLPAAKVGIDILSNAMAQFFAGLQGKGPIAGFKGTLNEIGLGMRALVSAFKEGDVTSKGLVGKFEFLGVTLRTLVTAFRDGTVTSGSWRGMLERLVVIIRALIDASIWLGQATATMVGWFRQHETTTKSLLITLGALVALTKLHATVMGVQAAGGALAMLKNLSLVASITKVVAAVQWAYNGALAAASYLQVAGYLGAIAVQQKLLAVWTKVITAAQWLWNVALTANPIGIVIVAIAAFVAAIVLLWNKNEGFRNWVLGTLWPSLKKAWEQLKAVFQAVVGAMVAAWNWLKTSTMSVWNAIWGFLQPIVSAIANFFKPIVAAFMQVQRVAWGFYNAAWKIIWIAIQVAVKLFVAYFNAVAMPIIRTAIAIIKTAIQVFAANWKTAWGIIQSAARAVANWFTGTIVPSFRKAWDQMKALITGFKNLVVTRWNEITAKIRSAFTTIAGPIANVLNAGISKIRGWLNTFKTWWNGLFDGVKNKSKSAMDGVVAAFMKGRDGIKRAWDSVVNVTKKPINFVINDVYNNRIRALWNKVAGAFGISTKLDTIKGFAKGGLVPGSGNSDTVPAMLTPGEGILTKKEMAALGGPGAFKQFRAAIAQYHNGGIVGGGGGTGDGPGGWFKSLAGKAKDFIQGMAGPVVKPLANAIKSFMATHLQGGGWSGLLRGGGNKMVDSLVNWVTKKDKEMPSIGGSGGAGMGYRRQQALISQAFPGLRMISGFRPGARTLSGNRSYHSIGRAVDYPPNRALALWIRSRFGSATKELITPWNELNLHNGRPHRYTGAVWNQHNFPGGNAHDHWAMDTASKVDPGWFMGYNGTGKPETLVNADKYGGNVFHVTINVNGAGDTKAVAKEIRDELTRLSKRNGGQSGLPKR